MMRVLFLLYAIWGFNWVVMKTANAYFPPVLFVAFRFLIGAAVMLSVCAWRRIPVPMTAVSIVLAGAAAWAASGIILKRHLQDSPPLQYSAWQMVVGSLLLFIVALIVPQPSIHWTTTAAACLLYNGILAAAVGFFLWNYILAHMEAGKAGVAILVVPVVGVVSGILVLGEAFTWHTALGILLVLGGVLLIVKPRRPRLSLTH